MVLRIEPWALNMVGKHSTTELHVKHFLKIIYSGAREMFQWLKTLAVLIVDLNSMPSTHTKAAYKLKPGEQCPLWPPQISVLTLTHTPN